MHVVRALCLFALAFSSACAATVGVSGPFRVPADGLAQCTEHCATMGMATGAVVVMADNVGCVCESADAVANNEHDSTASLGAMAALVAEQEERAREQRRQQQLLMQGR